MCLAPDVTRADVAATGAEFGAARDVAGQNVAPGRKGVQVPSDIGHSNMAALSFQFGGVVLRGNSLVWRKSQASRTNIAALCFQEHTPGQIGCLDITRAGAYFHTETCRYADPELHPVLRVAADKGAQSRKRSCKRNTI